MLSLLELSNYCRSYTGVNSSGGWYILFLIVHSISLSPIRVSGECFPGPPVQSNYREDPGMVQKSLPTATRTEIKG